MEPTDWVCCPTSNPHPHQPNAHFPRQHELRHLLVHSRADQALPPKILLHSLKLLLTGTLFEDGVPGLWEEVPIHELADQDHAGAGEDKPERVPARSVFLELPHVSVADRGHEGLAEPGDAEGVPCVQGTREDHEAAGPARGAVAEGGGVG